MAATRTIHLHHEGTSPGHRSFFERPWLVVGAVLLGVAMGLAVIATTDYAPVERDNPFEMIVRP